MHVKLWIEKRGFNYHKNGRKIVQGIPAELSHGAGKSEQVDKEIMKFLMGIDSERQGHTSI